MTTSTRRLALCVAAVVALAFVTGCNRNKVEGEGRLDPSGQVVLTRDDKSTTVAGSRSLESGDTVEVVEGSAKITLPGGDTLELRPRSVLAVNDGPDLRSGNLLVTTQAAPRLVRAAGSQVDASGTIRIDLTLALRVAAYGGKAVIRSGGRPLDVPALREASVPVVGVTRGPVPLTIDRNDPWDQRILGDTATKEPDLESRARGFDGLVAPADARSVAYYRNLLPGLGQEQAFRQADVDRLGGALVETAEPAARRFRAGDVLLGTAVAIQGKRGSFAERLAGAADFRTAGATWALVALDQQVPSVDGLLRLVDSAVNVAPLELAAPAPPGSGSGLGEPPPARPVGPTPTTRPVTRQTTATTRTTRPTASPTPTTPPPQQQPAQPARPALVQPLDPLLDSTVDPVVALLNDLLNNR